MWSRRMPKKKHNVHKYNIHIVAGYHAYAPEKKCITFFGELDINIPINITEAYGWNDANCIAPTNLT